MFVLLLVIEHREISSTTTIQMYEEQLNWKKERGKTFHLAESLSCYQTL